MQFLNAVQKRYSSFQEFVTYAADGAMHTHKKKKIHQHYPDKNYFYISESVFI